MNNRSNFFELKLANAFIDNDVKEVEDFLRHGLSPNYAFQGVLEFTPLGKTLLDVAVMKEQYEMAKMLTKYKCDPNLTYVIDVDEYGAVSVKEYSKPNRLKMTCMYPCIVKGDVEMVKLLVKAGFDINLRDERGCTSIWHAVDLGNYQMAKAILSSPTCDVNIYDATHLYPLHVAAIRADVKIASLLIRRGAVIDVRTVRGSTPLILACISACYDLVRLLLLNGANPNHRGINGHTSISAVLESCSDTAILDTLVESGARIDLDDVKKCLKNKLPLLRTCPSVLNTLKQLASTPSSLKMTCCLSIRASILRSRSDQDLVCKVQQLPLPNLVKEFLLLNHL